jgi:hypothetical protein
MQYIPLKKYYPNNNSLNNYVNFFWVIDCNHTDLNHKMLPMRNIDLIFNISRNSFYTDDTGSPQKLPNLYFYGLSSKQNFKLVKPSGNLFTIGVSFKPTGLFPILGIPIVEFKNKIINLSDLVPKLSHQWFEQILNANTLHDKLKSIEAGLLNFL